MRIKSLGGCITGLGFIILPVVCMVPRIRWVWGRMWGLRRGYVANPLTWGDALGLKAHPITDAIRNSTDDLQQKVIGVMDNAGDGARRYGALAMAEVTDSAGNKTILAASNGRDGAILRNDIRRHLPDDVVAVRSQITEGVVGKTLMLKSH